MLKKLKNEDLICPLLLAFSLAAVAIYEAVPRNVDAKVLSTGARLSASDGTGDNHVVSRFVDTDEGRAPIGIDQDGAFRYGQNVTCVLSHDRWLSPHLHDCRPR